MHNFNSIEPEGELFGELEFEADEEMEFDEEFDDEMEDGEMDFFFAEAATSAASPFDEATELELANELLEIESDEELDQFLGRLVRRAARGVRRFARSRVGRRLGRRLKSLARRALPIAGRAIGTAFGGPVGGAVGRRVGSFASRLFELEIEAMSPEDQELEVARRFVRLAGSATQEAIHAAQTQGPDDAAEAGLMAAARRHAPGLLRQLRGGGRGGRRGRSGRWVRRGNSITLMNV
ncbi:MAG: hypothetical protein AAGJ09_06510 [Pseudomonadota bacterium]